MSGASAVMPVCSASASVCSASTGRATPFPGDSRRSTWARRRTSSRVGRRSIGASLSWNEQARLSRSPRCSTRFALLPTRCFGRHTIRRESAAGREGQHGDTSGTPSRLARQRPFRPARRKRGRRQAAAGGQGRPHPRAIGIFNTFNIFRQPRQDPRCETSHSSGSTAKGVGPIQARSRPSRGCQVRFLQRRKRQADHSAPPRPSRTSPRLSRRPARPSSRLRRQQSAPPRRAPLAPVPRRRR